MSAAIFTPPTGLTIVTRDAWVPDHLRGQYKTWTPKTGISLAFLRLMRQLYNAGIVPDAAAVGEVLESIWRSVIIESELWVKVLRTPESALGGQLVEDWGRVSQKVITNNGVAFIVDAYQNSVELENMKFHALGTGSTAEAAGDTALVTELTTQYNPDNTRATGTTAENAANIFESVGTVTVDATVTIQEHGLMSQAATGGGVLFDRSLTGGQALVSADSLQATYRGTLTSGG